MRTILTTAAALAAFAVAQAFGQGDQGPTAGDNKSTFIPGQNQRAMPNQGLQNRNLDRNSVPGNANNMPGTNSGKMSAQPGTATRGFSAYGGDYVNGPEGWRYRWHNGRWWYWLPQERWVFFDNDHWADYDANSAPNPTTFQHGAGYMPQSGTSAPCCQGNGGYTSYYAPAEGSFQPYGSYYAPSYGSSGTIGPDYYGGSYGSVGWGWGHGWGR